MNPRYIKASTVKARPAFSATGSPISNLFGLDLFSPKGKILYQVDRVHISKKMQTALMGATVEGVRIETLLFDSLESCSLPGAPSYVVTGVAYKEGGILIDVPTEISRIRIFKFLVAGLLYCLGVGSLFSSSPWIAIFPLSIGVYIWCSYLLVPKN